MSRSMSRSDLSSNHPARTMRLRGFTLVELLVVIGIIAVLVGILLPALAKARQSANSVKCMANLRSIGQAIFMYAGAHRDSLPYGLCQANQAIQGNPAGLPEGADWSTLVLTFMSKQKGIGYSSQDQTTTGQPGGRAIFLCPEAFIDSKSAGPITQYSAHPRLMPDLQMTDWISGSATNYLRGCKLSKIKRPTEIGMIYDGTISSNGYMAAATVNYLDKFSIYTKANNYYMTDDYIKKSATVNASQPVDMTPSSGLAKDINQDSDANKGNVRFRHNRNSQANVLMVDGHVQSFHIDMRKTATPTQMTDLLRGNVCVNLQN